MVTAPRSRTFILIVEAGVEIPADAAAREVVVGQ
jgi:hypothetical protein